MLNLSANVTMSAWSNCWLTRLLTANMVLLVPGRAICPDQSKGIRVWGFRVGGFRFAHVCTDVRMELLRT